MVPRRGRRGGRGLWRTWRPTSGPSIWPATGLSGCRGPIEEAKKAGGPAHWQSGHFMATYRDLALLLHSGDVKAGGLRTVIIDEACDLDGACGEAAAP